MNSKYRPLVNQEKQLSDCCTIMTREYYDIVLIGRTGMGKSTLRNKPLNLDNTFDSDICQFQFESEIPGFEFSHRSGR